MTSITPKLTAAITTIAILAPAAGAQAATFQTPRPASHVASFTSARHRSAHHARRSTAKLQPDSRSI
jgi:hypothetical protein